MIAARPEGDGVLADVLAFLTLREDAIDARVARHPDFEGAADTMKRQLAVIADDLRAGMHEGAARALAKRRAVDTESAA